MNFNTRNHNLQDSRDDARRIPFVHASRSQKPYKKYRSGFMTCLLAHFDTHPIDVPDEAFASRLMLPCLKCLWLPDVDFYTVIGILPLSCPVQDQHIILIWKQCDLFLHNFHRKGKRVRQGGSKFFKHG